MPAELWGLLTGIEFVLWLMLWSELTDTTYDPNNSRSSL